MRVRRTVILLVLLVSAALPGSAFADVPANDAQLGATALPPVYAPASYPVSIPPVGPAPAGGWTDATSTDDGPALDPSCLGARGQQSSHSMWYQIKLLEAGVLSIKLSTGSVQKYQPVVTILSTANGASQNELACGQGGSDQLTDTSASASTYAPAGTYLVRIAAVGPDVGSPSDDPTLTLTETVQDVTAPSIQVSVSGKTRIVGPGEPYTFNASASRDRGSDLDEPTATWVFFDNGNTTQVRGNAPSPLIVKHAWKTAGAHEVTLLLSDKSGNTNTYAFYVLVHNFVPPTVVLHVVVPSPGARRLRVVLNHDVPIRVHLVVLQGARVLGVLPSEQIDGSNAKTSLAIALTKKVGKVGFVAVSGVASDLGQFPNRVPLVTCSVDPVHGGGVCG